MKLPPLIYCGVLCGRKLARIASRRCFLANPEGVIVKHYTEVAEETCTRKVIEDTRYLVAESD